MPQLQIIVNVFGGIVQDVFASEAAVEVIVVDWDDEGIDPGSPQRVEINSSDRPVAASVIEMPVESCSELAGTDIEQAIEAARCRGILPHKKGGASC